MASGGGVDQAVLPECGALSRICVAARRRDDAEATEVSSLAMRGLALAAMAIRGGAGDAREANVASLPHADLEAMCMRMARMNLDQCLAATGSHYERVFRLGRQPMGETGKCIAQGAESGAAMAAAYWEPARDPSGFGPQAPWAYDSPRPAVDADAPP